VCLTGGKIYIGRILETVELSTRKSFLDNFSFAPNSTQLDPKWQFTILAINLLSILSKIRSCAGGFAERYSGIVLA